MCRPPALRRGVHGEVDDDLLELTASAKTVPADAVVSIRSVIDGPRSPSSIGRSWATIGARSTSAGCRTWRRLKASSWLTRFAALSEARRICRTSS